MTVSWLDVFLTLAGLCLAVWIASKTDDFHPCKECNHNCNQGRDCPKADEL
jgi:hypothetical protein